MGPDQSLELAIGNKDKVVVQQIVKIVQTKKAKICEILMALCKLNSTFVNQGHKTFIIQMLNTELGPFHCPRHTVSVDSNK